MPTRRFAMKSKPSKKTCTTRSSLGLQGFETIKRRCLIARTASFYWQMPPPCCARKNQLSIGCFASHLPLGQFASIVCSRSSKFERPIEE